MNHLIIFAHPKHESFNNAILDRVVAALEAKGDQVVVRDLYALGFNPVLTSKDMDALRQGNVAQDVAREQAFITQADTIIFIHPLWWTGLPAILKGYVDRVFTYGFAYRHSQAGGIEGLLSTKKGALVTTHGTPSAHYESTDMTKALQHTTDVGIFNFCGIDVAKHFFFGEVPTVDDATRLGILTDIQEAFRTLF